MTFRDVSNKHGRLSRSEVRKMMRRQVSGWGNHDQGRARELDALMPLDKLEIL